MALQPASIDLHLGNGLVRSYSLVNPPHDGGRYVVAVNLDPASRGGSRYIHDSLRAGQTIEVGGPRNNFELVEDAPEVVLIAGGIGITPMWCMVQHLETLGRRWRLFYSARSRSKCAYLADIQALEAARPGRVQVHIDDENDGRHVDLAAIVASVGPDAHGRPLVDQRLHPGTHPVRVLARVQHHRVRQRLGHVTVGRTHGFQRGRRIGDRSHRVLRADELRLDVGGVRHGVSGACTGSTQEVDRQLAAIKAKPGVERTQADTAYLQTHDERLLTLQEKIRTSGNASLTSDEVDYMQKAGGFVNTMAYLSNSEKALYDKMVSEGQGEAAQALHLVGMSRIGMSGQQITLPDGQHFDPTRTQVSAASLRNLFSHLFVDPGGQTDRQFEALATYLDQQATSQPQG